MSEDLINKYRPQTFDEVLGQDQICKSIKSAIRKRRGHTFLLTGPSGVGKTTLGRIIANTVGCAPIDLTEIDGATNTGIDAMREVMSRLQFKSMGGGARVTIVDECHALSQQAWKSLLKSLEEPPEGVYWILCTTEPSKVPKEVKTRCVSYDLTPVSRTLILELLREVARGEKLPIRSNVDALEVIADLAEGSPRQALSYLAKCGHLKDEEDVREICEDGGPVSKEAIDLCRLLIRGASWKDLTSCIDKIEGAPESVRIIVLRYMASTVLKSSKPQRALAVMEAFDQPFLDREGKAPLLLACGRLCF